MRTKDEDRNWEEELNSGRKMMNLFFDTVVVLLAMNVPVKRPPGRQIFGAEL